MSIRAGQILHAANRRGYVIDRIQTGGPGDLNIPTEKINELGNFRSVATVRDVPDLSFNLDMLNVGTEVEEILTDKVGTWGPFEFDVTIPMDIISPWKTSQGDYSVVNGVVIPGLYLESVSYAFGLEDNAGQTFTLVGDAIFYTPGTPALMEAEGDGAETDFAFEDDLAGTGTPVPVTALLYVEQGINQYALNVSVDGERMTPDSGGVGTPNGDGDYTQDSAGVYFSEAPALGASIRIAFAHSSESTWDQDVHEGVAVKPGAIRGKDINVFINGGRWTDVQSVAVDWSVTLEEDMEFGNPRAVARDFTDVPEVTGNIVIKPRSVASLFAKLREVAGITASDQVIGPQSSVAVPLEIRLQNPGSGGSEADPDGAVLKTLYVPDARFTLPGYEGAVETKMENTLNFESDEGVLQVFKGNGGSLTPATGLEAGGETITITGFGFTGATGVSFGGTAATSFTVVDDNTIEAVAPAGTGTVSVSVTRADGSIFNAGEYVYTA